MVLNIRKDFAFILKVEGWLVRKRILKLTPIKFVGLQCMLLISRFMKIDCKSFLTFTSGCKQVIYRHLAADICFNWETILCSKSRTRSGRRYFCYLYENVCELQSNEYCVAVLILLSVLKSVSYVATKINKRDRTRENEQEERRGKMRNFCS